MQDQISPYFLVKPLERGLIPNPKKSKISKISQANV